MTDEFWMRALALTSMSVRGLASYVSQVQRMAGLEKTCFAQHLLAVPSLSLRELGGVLLLLRSCGCVLSTLHNRIHESQDHRSGS